MKDEFNKILTDSESFRKHIEKEVRALCDQLSSRLGDMPKEGETVEVFSAESGTYPIRYFVAPNNTGMMFISIKEGDKFDPNNKLIRLPFNFGDVEHKGDDND